MCKTIARKAIVFFCLLCPVLSCWAKSGYSQSLLIQLPLIQLPLIQLPLIQPSSVQPSPLEHPLQPGQIFQSFGGHFTYRVIGACCRLFDREELPYPCCRIAWRGKEPSWRRIGKRFTPDLATRNSPSYCVEILGQESAGRSLVITLYAVKLSPSVREWWHSKRMQAIDPVHENQVHKSLDESQLKDG